MALPSAQLGQLPSMQVPFYTPVVPVSKEPKAWEKALLSILTNTAANVVSRGVENFMQPDYAETPRTGFSKFWSGPQEDRAQHAQGKKQEFDTMMEQFKLDNARTQQNSAQDYGLMRDTNAFAERGLESIDQSNNAQALERLRQSGALAVEGQRTQHEQELAKLRATLESQDPYRIAGTKNLEAQTGYHQAQADKDKLSNDMIRASLEQQALKSGKPPVGPAPMSSLPGLPKPGAAPVQPPRATDPEQRTRDLLSRGLDPETIALMLQAERNMPSPQQEATNAQMKQDDLVRSILDRAGLTNRQRSDEMMYQVLQGI